ncbi:MAG: hypothetical protein HYU86_07920 [Chloroflexi bacterium]|nr:hypothetical protein [Chloroflexota bacterium]
MAIVCAYCGGRGEVPARSGITCIVCRGKGVVSVPEPMADCPGCRGTGATPGSGLPCLRCRGKGVIAVRKDKDKETPGDFRGEALSWVAARGRWVLAETVKGLPSLENGYRIEHKAPGPTMLPRRRMEIRAANPRAVSALVRQLMATERVRILGSDTDLRRYTMEKRTQRWREFSKKPRG